MGKEEGREGEREGGRKGEGYDANSRPLFPQVFQYDGSMECTSPEFAVFALIGLILVIFFVAPTPFAVGYVCIRRPQVRGRGRRKMGM